MLPYWWGRVALSNARIRAPRVWGSPGLLPEQHRPAVQTRFPQFHPGCMLSPGSESWDGDLEVFRFRAVFSCRLQSLFA